MERLTSRNEDCVRINGHGLHAATIGEIVQMAERLAAYEDTGLEPEAVETVKLALLGKTVVDIETFNDTPISRLIELAKADKDGRALILPCKAGDTVWFARSAFRTAANPIEAVALCVANHGGAGLTYTARTANGGLQRKFAPGQIGKTVFLTREEAKRAMEDKKNGDKTSL